MKITVDLFNNNYWIRLILILVALLYKKYKILINQWK